MEKKYLVPWSSQQTSDTFVSILWFCFATKMQELIIGCNQRGKNMQFKFSSTWKNRSYNIYAKLIKEMVYRHNVRLFLKAFLI